jgi:hypothetical protein
MHRRRAAVDQETLALLDQVRRGFSDEGFETAGVLQPVLERSRRRHTIHRAAMSLDDQPLTVQASPIAPDRVFAPLCLQ